MIEIQAHDVTPGMIIAECFTHPGAPQYVISAVKRVPARFSEGEFEHEITHYSSLGPQTFTAYAGQYLPIVEPSGLVRVFVRNAEGIALPAAGPFVTLEEAVKYSRAVRGTARAQRGEVLVSLNYLP